jgi:shikimate dehydrogenase
MKNFGLIGYPLSHSFSPGYFTKKFETEGVAAQYQAYPIATISDFNDLIQAIEFTGLNVTIPYKQQVIPYLHSLDPTATAVGAVNTIKFHNGKSKGYNTDVFGFEMSLLGLISSPSDIRGALVLGSGGASKAVQYVLSKLNIPFKLISRNSETHLTYSAIDQELMSQTNLIINTTPLGMYPDDQSKPQIPYHWLNKNYFLYDLVYNPEKTIFLTEGMNRGCKTKNGHDMLILQAEKAWEIWNQQEM